MADVDVSLAEKGLKTKYIGRKIVYKSETETTMNDAELGAKQGDPHGTVYIANRMTSARGTKGRRWTAESTGNLYMSFVLHIDLHEVVDPYTDRTKEFDLDITGALATLQVLEELGLSEVKIKWLNDLWIKGHKLLGALTEYKGKITVDSCKHHLYILGIGLNLNCDMRRDPIMHSIATSVKCELGHTLAREEVLSGICNRLEALLEVDRKELMKLYTLYEAIRPGDRLFVQKEQDTRLCQFEGVNGNWSVNLRDGKGVLFSPMCTEVSLRPYREKEVYILQDPDIETWSCQLLMKTCSALVDSQKYEVRSVPAAEVTFGSLSSCSLIVIGHFKRTPSTAGYVTLVMDYIRSGGSCLCTGNACSLFQSRGTFKTKEQEHSEQRPTLITTKLNKKHFKIHSEVNLCISYESSKISVDHLMSTKVLAGRDFKNDVQKTSCAVDRFDVNDIGHNKADVVVCDVEKGKLCFCTPNIEVTYAEIEGIFPGLSDKAAILQQTNYERDCLILEILKELGL